MSETTTPATPAAPNRTRPWLLLLGAAALALLILVGAVLPVEFGRDPLGLGRLAGLDKLASAAPVVPAATRAAPAQRSETQPFRTLELEFALQPGGDFDGKDEVEYKVAMEPGQAILYRWEVVEPVGDDAFYTDFHGHTVTPGKAPVSATSYREGMGAHDQGSLSAAFKGVHGWYFQNQSEQPVHVKLRVTGYFSLVPAGEPGNEAGLQARVSG